MPSVDPLVDDLFYKPGLMWGDAYRFAEERIIPVVDPGPQRTQLLIDFYKVVQTISAIRASRE